MSNEVVLKFHKVQKKFGDFTALKDVSFEVKKGEFFALLGPNGAGKTTLINCLCGLTDRTSGEIAVLGVDPEKDPVHTKLSLGIVEQEVNFDPFFTPMEILRLRRGLFGLPADDAYLEWILEKLSLTDKKDVRARQLSGGMKRRLMIAKALAHDPPILILDEPTAGVDVDLRNSLYDFLRELRTQKQKTIVLTTHYLEEAELLADRVAIQNLGETIICDTTKNLLGKKNRTLVIETCEDEEVRVEIDNNSLDLESIVANYPHVKNLRIHEPKLEEVFLEFTKNPKS